MAMKTALKQMEQNKNVSVFHPLRNYYIDGMQFWLNLKFFSHRILYFTHVKNMCCS